MRSRIIALTIVAAAAFSATPAPAAECAGTLAQNCSKKDSSGVRYACVVYSETGNVQGTSSWICVTNNGIVGSIDGGDTDI